MSDIDLSAVRPAMAILLTQHAQGVLARDGLFDTDETGEFIDRLLAEIEAAVREQVAREIEARLAKSDGWESHPNAFLWGMGMCDAARIARDNS